jgi:plastocyanin
MGRRALIPMAIVAVAAAVATACGGAGTPASEQAAAQPTAQSAAKLTIQHVQQGCHVWSNGSQQLATMQLTLAKGGSLELFNNDIDTHQLVQQGGPALDLGAPMAAAGGEKTLVFSEPGTYTFGTTVIEPAGEEEGAAAMDEGGDEVPDNVLQLVVRVA